MLNRIIPGILTLTLIVAGGAAPVPDTLRSGFWEGRMLMSVAAPGTTVTPPQGEGVVIFRKCSDAPIPMANIFRDMNKECTAQTFNVQKGRLSAHLICAPDEDGMSLDFNVEGPLSTDRIDLTLTGHMGDKNIEMAVGGKIALIRTRDCLPEDERS